MFLQQQFRNGRRAIVIGASAALAVVACINLSGDDRRKVVDFGDDQNVAFQRETPVTGPVREHPGVAGIPKTTRSPCATRDLTLPSGECVPASLKGQVFFDPCNPVGKQAVTGGFGPYNGRDNATSPGIGKLERHRLFCLLAPSLFNEILSKRMAHVQPYDSKADHLDFKGQASLVPLRVLAFAPQGEQATLRVALEAAAQHGHFPVDFVPADIDGEQVRGIVGRAGLGMNAEEIAFPDKFFDAVIFSHVLEHVTDMRPALAEIGRVLNDDGFAVLSAPIYQEDTFEDRDCVTEECRLEKFGQKDHVRRVGWDVLGTIKEHFADVRKGQTTDLMNVKFGELLPWFKNPELSQNSRDVYLYAFKSVPSPAVTRVFD